jgi:hypothetical protein
VSDRQEFGLGDDYGTDKNPSIADVTGIAGQTFGGTVGWSDDSMGTATADQMAGATTAANATAAAAAMMDIDEMGTDAADAAAASAAASAAAANAAAAAEAYNIDEMSFSSDDTTGGSSGTGSDTATGPADTEMDYDEDYGWGEEADDSPDSCVIASHAISTGSFSNLDRARAIAYCKRKYHGKWYGEIFRKGYQHLGKKAIERGDAADHYDEFKDFVAVGRGHKSDLKTRLNFYRRTAQFFLTGLGLTIKEKINANR